jgi:hypothetical protein
MMFVPSFFMQGEDNSWNEQLVCEVDNGRKLVLRSLMTQVTRQMIPNFLSKLSGSINCRVFWF